MKPEPHSCLACASYLDIEGQCLSAVRPLPDPALPNVCFEFHQKGEGVQCTACDVVLTGRAVPYWQDGHFVVDCPDCGATGEWEGDVS